DGDAHLAPDALGQPVVFGQRLPGVAPVARDVEAAPRSAARQVPGPAPRLPEAGEDDARIRGVDGDVAGPGVRVLLQDLLPRLAALTGVKHALPRVGAEARGRKRPGGGRG